MGPKLGKSTNNLNIVNKPYIAWLRISHTSHLLRKKGWPYNEIKEN